MPIRVLRLSAFVGGTAFLAACAAGPAEGLCTDELLIDFGPRDTTVRVGGSFHARIALSSCGGRVQLSDSFTWTAADPTVVQVDASTGRVTALAPGETTIAASGERYGVWRVRVTVRATGP